MARDAKQTKRKYVKKSPVWALGGPRKAATLRGKRGRKAINQAATPKRKYTKRSVEGAPKRPYTQSRKRMVSQAEGKESSLLAQATALSQLSVKMLDCFSQVGNLGNTLNNVATNIDAFIQNNDKRLTDLNNRLTQVENIFARPATLPKTVNGKAKKEVAPAVVKEEVTETEGLVDSGEEVRPN